MAVDEVEISQVDAATGIEGVHAIGVGGVLGPRKLNGQLLSEAWADVPVRVAFEHHHLQVRGHVTQHWAEDGEEERRLLGKVLSRRRRFAAGTLGQPVGHAR